MLHAVETEREDDDRWIAELPAVPGALAYGSTRSEAVGRAEALALRVRMEMPIVMNRSSPTR